MDYRALDYLLKDYALNYAYSATLWVNNSRKTQRNYTFEYGGFAPEYTSNAISSVNTSGGLFDLPAARDEVVSISNLVGGKAFLESDATKEKFLEDASQFRILHLAMHGLVEEEEPDHLETRHVLSLSGASQLVFAPVGNGPDNYLLTMPEIYNLRLNADLVVLSACNTGYGKVVKGEGVMSLSRPFIYAGSPSLVLSLWQVPDNGTKRLMYSFFEELLKGKNKDEALRQAKLTYLEDNPKSASHPIYWAGFITTGNNAALF